MEKLLLSQMITLIGADLGTYEVALFEENEKGEVFDIDTPVGFYECYKEHYLHYYHYKHIGDKKLVDERDFGNLVVLGIRTSNNLDTDYPFCVCVKVKKNQVSW